MKDTVFISLVTVLVAGLAAASDFALKGDPCSKSDLCGSKVVPKTCSCAADCHLFGTCCQDVAEDVTPEYRCYGRKVARPVFAKRACDKDFQGHVGDRLACFDDDEDEMDVANTLLVTSLKTKIVYWNRHCARCSHEEEGDLEFWNIDVRCPKHPGIDASLIRRNLTFRPEGWGLDTGDTFYLCSVLYSPPNFADQVNHCTPHLLSSCPDNYTDADVATKCSQYYAERRGKDVVYKNIHCAICGAANIQDLECPGMSPEKEEVEDQPEPADTVQVTFYGGDWLEREPGKEFECSRGFAYDPARKKCRSYEIKEYPVPVSRSRAVAPASALVAVTALLLAL